MSNAKEMLYMVGGVCIIFIGLCLWYAWTQKPTINDADAERHNSDLHAGGGLGDGVVVLVEISMHAPGVDTTVFWDAKTTL